MTTKETEKGRIETRLLNKPLIAIAVATSTVVAAVVGHVTGFVQLWEKIAPQHEPYYAAEISDEYYVRLATLDNKELAEQLHSKLVLLSQLSAKYENEDPQGNFRSSSVMIGFEPDQIVFARSDNEPSKWIVGVDVESGQGATRNTQEELAKIRNRFVNIQHEYQSNPQHELAEAAAAVRSYFDNATVVFFSSVKYRQTNGHPISKKAP